MSNVVLKIWDNGETMYTYEIIDEGSSYSIWVSTTPLRGREIGGEFYEFMDALEWLTNFIKEGEDVVEDSAPLILQRD